MGRWRPGGGRGGEPVAGPDEQGLTEPRTRGFLDGLSVEGAQQVGRDAVEVVAVASGISHRDSRGCGWDRLPTVSGRQTGPRGTVWTIRLRARNRVACNRAEQNEQKRAYMASRGLLRV